ncbi:hypothetical protein ACO2Q0_03080 [Phenylobacterium sp. VNQ135]|uniref:hypothetical protein n=1 Tax=Phenylobacterium sp. VNQ135 TaxID=3400922 RepID=UPI003C0316F2
MPNALEPHDYDRGFPGILRRLTGRFGYLGIAMYLFNFVWGDPELWPYALGCFAAGYLALIWSSLIGEDHERFRQGDFWRCAGLFSLSLAPWLLFIPFWSLLTTIPGLIVITATIMVSGCVATWLVFSGKRLRTTNARVQVLKAAAMFWCVVAVVLGGLWPLVAPAGGWQVASLAVGVTSALFSFWLARRFWTQPPEPYRHRIDFNSVSPSAD